MKSKYPIFLLILLSPFGLLAQIYFEEKAEHPELLQRALKADRAIQKAEFGEIHSLLVIKDGKMVFEKYYSSWTKDSLHQLQSATKSVVSTLMGCALQLNYIKSTDERVLDFFPELMVEDKRLQQLRIEDLLTQRHGFKWKEQIWDDPENSWRRVMQTEGNWYHAILETPMDTLPGRLFNYSNAAPVLVAGIIQRASGLNIDLFAKKYLFDPLGIKRFQFWQGNKGPQNNGMALLYLSSRDMAKLGQLYLQNGKWNGVQLIPESFVLSAISSHVKNEHPNGFYRGYDYGYFWWSQPVTTENVKSNVFLARGAGGQNIIVSREENMVVVITAWNAQQPNKPQRIYENYLIN
ncbi:MAG: serine hydrolase [Saprospiraceae bacterium]|nr:serine hydrolase [Saprospiraceae bacterium]